MDVFHAFIASGVSDETLFRFKWIRQMSQDQLTIKLQEECNIYTILPIKEQLIEAAASCTTLCLDLTDVERVDACFLQLLHSANLSLYEKGGELILQNTPEDLTNLSDKTLIPLPTRQLVEEMCSENKLSAELQLES